MDFDAKYREKFSSNNFPLFFPDNFSKSRDQFTLEEGFSSSKGATFLQDFHPLENFNLNNGSSPTSSSNHPIFSMQPQTCFEPFDHNSSSLGYLPNFDFYEAKPFNSTLVPFVDHNFNANGVLGHNAQMITPLTLINSTSSAQLTSNPFGYLELCSTKYRAPDEGSCTTPKNNTMAMTSLVKKGGRGKKKKTNVVKGQWTIEEDRLLVQLVERYGVRKWSQIAQLLNGRIGKQCRERWHNHLRPDIKKDVWSEEEDRILIKAHAEIGNKWAEIAKRLPGRTENSIKNHWNATKRRQFSRRKCRSKYPRQSSLLQEYIKNLDPETINAGCRKKPSLPIEDNANNNKSSNDQNETYEYSSSSDRLGPQEYDFSEVPDFNFDAQLFEESSIDSLLDCGSNQENDHNAMIIGYEEQGKTSSENLNDTQFDLASIMQCGVKKELDLVEMINQVNL